MVSCTFDCCGQVSTYRYMYGQLYMDTYCNTYICNCSIKYMYDFLFQIYWNLLILQIVLVSLGTNVGWKVWGAVSVPVHLKGVQWCGESESGLCVGHSSNTSYPH